MNKFYRAIFLALCLMTSGSIMAENLPLKADYFTTCADRTASNTTQCIAGNDQGVQYGGYIFLQGYNNYYRLENGRFQEFLDGTASLTGQWINVANGNIRWDVDIHLNGRTTNKPTDSPKVHHCLNPNTDGFYYYTHTSGTLTGRNSINGAKIKVARYGEAFQVGIGANVTHNALTFGASGWLMLTIENQPSSGPQLVLESGNSGQTGDININLNGSPTACTNNPGDISINCPQDITLTAGQGQNGAAVNYSTPNATTTCMVDGGTNCNIIPNNISGFKYLGERNGSKYYCSDTNNFTWHQANHEAMMNGGYLAVICSESENEFIRSRLLNPDAWIGYTDENEEGNFRWVNGEACTFTKWRTSTGEPNNGGTDQDEHFVRMLRDENGQWTDRDRHYTTEFVMEIPCEPNMNPGNVTVNRVAGPASGSTFQIGMTTVTYEAVDECGNTETCSFKVTVNPPADPCANNGGDNDGDGVCANADCNDNDASIGASQPQGTACNDGNPNTENDVIQADGCTCAGEIIDPCADKGGDNDGDGICFDDDCNDFNANVGARQPQGTSCDDGNPNTVNDEIQGDGCSCAGLPSGSISIFCVPDITVTAAQGQNSVIVNFGQPNVNSTCALGGLSVSQTSGLPTGSAFPIGMTTITFTASDACGNVESCSFKVTVNETVDPCAAKGGDTDGDGVCADDDCDDNNASVGAKLPVGTSCDDGNPNTGNDVILADGCTCEGQTVDPCAAKGGDNDGDGVCKDDDCNDNDASIGAKLPVGTSCDDGDGNTINDVIQADGCTCEGEPNQQNKAKVGDFVFQDNNANGIQDAGEPGLGGIFVLLTNLDNGIAKFAISGNDGMYMFGDLDPGNYTLKFVGQPSDLVGTEPDQGNDDTKDSDMDPMTGITPAFSLAAGETNLDIDAGFRPVNVEPTCTADAGTLSGGASVTIVAGEAALSAASNGDEVVPSGFSKIYVLTRGDSLVIEQTNGTPDFIVTAAGKYTIHTLVYDPATLDLGIVIPGITTGFDVNSILIQGGGTICGSLDVNGTMFMVEEPQTGCLGNVTNGGQIGGDEDPANCGGFDPSLITNEVSPSGGNGTIEYIWLASTVECPTELSDQIAGATGPTYDPGPITETTYFVRCARTVGCTVWIESNCVVKKVDDCGTSNPDCSTIAVSTSDGKITVDGLIAPIVAVKVYDLNNGWNQVFTCFNDCDKPAQMINVVSGNYRVQVQFYTASWEYICEENVDVTVGGGGCTDNDGDGVCQADDCNDNDASVGAGQTPGTSCDDGNPNTSNDVIQADGCSCAGTPDTGCTDNDGDGVCQEDDCNDNDASIGARQTQGTSCDDGNPNTSNDVIQADGCSCAGTPDTGGDPDCNLVTAVDDGGKITISGLAAPVVIVKVFDTRNGWATIFECTNDCDVPVQMVNAAAGDYNVQVQFYTANWEFICDARFDVTVGGGGCTDNDGDGVCQADDCNDNDASIGAGQTPGTSCNDGNPNTSNDVIQADGCSCAGTPDTGCTDNDGDGVCVEDDCNDNDASVGASQPQGTACDDGNANTSNDVIQADGCSCAGTPDTGGNPDCNNVTVSGDNGKITINGLVAPVVSVKVFDKNNGWAEVFSCFNDCDTPMQMVNSGNGDFAVKVQFYNASWGFICEKTFDVTVSGGTGCTDNDGDGVCVQDDCNDNDASVGASQPQGTACDDGNANTSNDVIQADGCTCAGTPDTGGGLNCDDVVVTGEPGKLKVNNLTAPIVAINILDKNNGWAEVFSCFNDCDVPMQMLDLPASDYFVKVQFYNANWGFLCEKGFDVTVPPGVDPCADKGGDNDGDGVCADEDCNDNDASIGATQPQGTACNDGNPDTENDVIQADGCTCAGEPVGPAKCANRTVFNTQHCSAGSDYGFFIVHNHLEKRYTFQNGAFMEFTDGTAMLTGTIVNNGDNQITFEVNINFTGRTNVATGDSPKEHNCVNPDYSKFYYYADVTGTLMGGGKAAGAVLTVRDHAESFQVGIGANITNKDLSFGASGWLKIEVQSQPTGNLSFDIYDGNNGQNGDININLSGDGTECPNGASSRTAPSNAATLLAQRLTVYPNPAEEELYLQLKPFAGKKGHLSIVNLYGQLVQEMDIEAISKEALRLDISNFQNGVYYLHLNLENTQPFSKKFLVHRMY